VSVGQPGQLDGMANRSAGGAVRDEAPPSKASAPGAADGADGLERSVEASGVEGEAQASGEEAVGSHSARVTTALQKRARRVAIGGMGFTSLVLGLIFLPLPTPLGVVFIPLGLMILALEFPWAERWLDWVERRTGKLGRGIRAARAKAQHWVNKLVPW